MGGIILWVVKYRSFLIWLLAVSSVFASGLYSGSVLCDLSKAREEHIRQEKVNKMINDANREGVKFEEKRKKINKLRVKLASEVQNEKNPSYSCDIGADGMHQINDTLAAYRAIQSDK